MRFPRVYCFPLFLILFLLVACEESAQPALKLNKGQQFPDFNAIDLLGKPITYRHPTGKALIINVWATWCGPCRHELPSLQRLQDKLDRDKYLVIGLALDSDDHLVREYLIDRKISYPNYLDTDMTIANDTLGIRVYPSTYLVSPDGIIQEVIEGWREWDNAELITRIQQLRDL